MSKDQDLKREGDRLYEQYGRPLEAEHWGEYVAISADGRTLLAPTLAEALAKSSHEFDGDSFAFKVGPRIAVTFRSVSRRDLRNRPPSEQSSTAAPVS